MGRGRPAQACLLEPWNRGSFCHAHHSSATCGAANTCSRLGRAGIKMRSALQTSCTAFYLHHVFLPTAFRQSVTYPVRATSHRLVSTHPHWAVEWMLFTSCIIGCSREGTKQRTEKGEEKGRVARHIEDHHTGSSSTPINQSYPNSLSNRYNIIPLLWEESHRHILTSSARPAQPTAGIRRATGCAAVMGVAKTPRFQGFSNEELSAALAADKAPRI